MTINTSKKNTLRDIKRIALPISFQAFLISALQLVDNLFLGHLKDSEYVSNGVNAINNITFLVSTMITGFIASIGIYFIQASKTSNKDLQNELFKIKIFYAIALSAILLTLISVALKPIASLWISSDGKEKSLEAARDYGNIMIPSLFLDFMITVFANSYKEIQKPKTSVVIALCAIAINSSLNYVLMYKVGLGIQGAAFATLTARVFEVVLWTIVLIIKKPEFIPHVKTWIFVDFKKAMIIFPKCLFWTINQLLISGGFVLQIMFISQISTQSGSSLNSAGVVIQLTNAFMGGFSQAISILIVGYIANKNNEALHIYIKNLSSIAIAFGLMGMVILGSISPLMLVLYPNYQHKTNIESIIMIVSVALTFPTNLFITIKTSALKGGGYAKSLILVDGLFSWLLTLPLTIILTHVPNQLSYGEIYGVVTILSVIKIVPVEILWWKKKNAINPLTYQGKST